MLEHIRGIRTYFTGFAGESVEREYTPLLRFGDSISGCSNTLMLMIKIYPYGKMTQHLSTIKIGKLLVMIKDTAFTPALYGGYEY